VINDVEQREMIRIAEEAIEEARAGLTATRIVGGWRLTLDRAPGGAWVFSGAALTQGDYPQTPPEKLCGVVGAILAGAGVIGADAGTVTTSTASHHVGVILRTFADLRTGKLNVTWTEPAK
jgi:hypothetical protein